MNTPVVVRNSVTVLVPEGSVDSWRAICQLLGHSLYWDQESGVLHVDSVLHGLTVVIDPGHGGSDRAGRGAMGYVEADAVLDVALRLAPLLEGIGGRVILTRDRDATVTLEERVRMVRLARADFLLSLHSSPHLPPGQLQTLHTVL
ncbi:MAG TPA: N-acetylmuramoyl-L-alanine amidase, partial [Firmicutes bacterium]|nr:N-acetylmuramoyl-L-alanine amidase [Bacillota bacterium]